MVVLVLFKCRQNVINGNDSNRLQSINSIVYLRILFGNLGELAQGLSAIVNEKGGAEGGL